MAVQIDAGSRDQIVRNLAKKGGTAPDWVSRNPRLNRIWLETAAGGKPPAGGTKPARPAGGPPAPAPTSRGRAQPTPAASAAAAKKPAGRPGRGRGHIADETGRAAAKINTAVGTPQILTRAAGGSATGGLLLAIFIYPLVMATLKEGAKGPGMWIKAKFLNIVPEPPATRGGDVPRNGAGPTTPPARYDPSFAAHASGQAVPA